MKSEVHGDALGTIEVDSSGGAYPVIVGAGLLGRLHEVIEAYAPAQRLALITDDHVGPLHGEGVAAACRAVGHDVTYLTFPDGEASKTRKSWSILTDEMLEAGLGRDCVVVAVGGGVVTDLAGFVAATYLRGVPVVQVPTSYLAMIDASVGGKTGVDVRSGKNLVGAFHPPAAVLADVDVLGTLPAVERGQGLVEAFKHGAILEEDYFVQLEDATVALLGATPEVAAQCVLESVRIKARVVAEDEFESGYRQVLNFGHTIGHAIEAASGYSLGHGSAVALGMLAEAEIGEVTGVTEPGTRDRIEAAVAPLLEGVTVDVDPVAAIPFITTDKKARKGRPRYVLLRRLGEIAQGDAWTHEVPDAVAGEAMTRVLAAR
jgi:3-dehydroquinate synthase